MPWHRYLESATEKLKAIKLPRDAAGHSLTAKVPIAFSDETVGQVKARFFQELEHYDTINYIYVLTKHHHLSGVASIKDFFTSPDTTKITKLYSPHPTVSHPQVDQEKVAHLAIKHNIKAVPLVDGDGHFLGVVPSGKIISILNHEIREDLYKSAGIMSPSHGHVEFDEAMNNNILIAFKHRSPWIIIGLFGGIFMAQVVDGFEHMIAEHVILAAFIPLIVYLSGAVGAQSQTLYIRDLVLNPKLKFGFYLLKQLFVATLMAIACGLIIWLVIFLFWQNSYSGFVIGLSAAIAVATSTLIALVVPFVLNSIKQDPANGSGPFGTMLLDLVSIIIYFLVASALM